MNNKKVNLIKLIRSSSSSSAKLTFKDAEEIRKKYLNGNITQRELAEEYCISQVQINHIIRNITWNYMEE